MTTPNQTTSGVHESHCCKVHGCKYGDSDCPVVLGAAPQRHRQECCENQTTSGGEGESPLDILVRVLSACAPLEVEEAGDVDNVTTFTCPTCSGEGNLASDEVLTMHASPSDFPVGAVGIQCFGIGEGHGELQRALNELPKAIADLRAERDSALSRLAQVEAERDALKQSILDLSHPNILMFLADRDALQSQLDEARKLIAGWEEVGRKQRELSETIKERELKASMIASSNAWMACADDLKKIMEKIMEKTK